MTPRTISPLHDRSIDLTGSLRWSSGRGDRDQETGRQARALLRRRVDGFW